MLARAHPPTSLPSQSNTRLTRSMGTYPPTHQPTRSPLQPRSYLFVEDVAEAFDCILHRGDIGEVYNIGTEKERTVLEVAKTIG